MMKPQFTYPLPTIFGRHPTYYYFCLWITIGLSVTSLTFILMLLIALIGNNHSDITELLAGLMLVGLSIGLFLGLAILYTILFNEVAYHVIKQACVYIQIGYCGICVLWILWALISSGSNPGIRATILPALAQGLVTGANTYFFYHAYDVPGYNFIPTIPHMMYQPVFRMPMQVPQMPAQIPVQMPMFQTPYPQY